MKVGSSPDVNSVIGMGIPSGRTNTLMDPWLEEMTICLERNITLSGSKPWDQSGWDCLERKDRHSQSMKDHGAMA